MAISVQSARGCRLGLRAGSRRPAPFSRCAVVVRAEGSSAPPTPIWPVDTESARDVFAFGGSAPERVNGRIAMIGFVSILGPEFAKKQPVLEQVGDAVLPIILFSLTITFASILPKLISGYPLKQLHEGATTENMKGEGVMGLVSVFDTNIELWSGRLAMLGFAGLILIELVKGESFF